MEKRKTTRAASATARCGGAPGHTPTVLVGRPMREMLRSLARMGGTTGSQTGEALADVELLESLRQSAEASMKTIHLGLGSLGQLVARSSLDIEDGSVSAECVESLGFLMAELGDLAAECMRIASECRSASPKGEVSRCEQ